MTAEEKTFRVGLESRRAFEAWLGDEATILRPDEGEVPAWDTSPPLVADHGEASESRWALGQLETGRVAFTDAGDGTAEMVVEVDHSDPDPEHLSRRLEGIIRRFGVSIVGEAGSIDPPAAIEDPRPGAALDERTDPDQPL